MAISTSKKAMNADAASTRKAMPYPAATTIAPAAALLRDPPTPCTVPMTPRLTLAAGAPQDIGQQQRDECVKKTDAYTVQHLRSDQP